MEKINYILNIEEFSLYLQAEKIFSEGTILLYKTVLERFFQFCSQNQNELENIFLYCKYKALSVLTLKQISYTHIRAHKT